MTNNNERSEGAKKFTDAVKTIVNVPKNAVDPKLNVRKLDDKLEGVTCPDCGAKYVRPTKHKH